LEQCWDRHWGPSTTPSPVPAPQVSMEYNPGWNSSSVNLLHVRAVGPEDTLHYVWSSIGAPSVLLVATRSPSSALRVNWTQLLSPSPAGAVWIDPPDSVVYSTAVVFTKLFEFSEAKPLGELFYPTYDLSEFSWESLNHTLNRTALTAELRGVPASDPGGAFANGSLAFRVRHRQGARQGAGGTSKGQGAHPGGRELVQRAEGTFRGQGTSISEKISNRWDFGMLVHGQELDLITLVGPSSSENSVISILQISKPSQAAPLHHLLGKTPDTSPAFQAPLNLIFQPKTNVSEAARPKWAPKRCCGSSPVCSLPVEPNPLETQHGGFAGGWRVQLKQGINSTYRMELAAEQLNFPSSSKVLSK
uniref:GLMPB protein n=1 Tax=Junco hyemalis TaxID=40217 RepID=A0A8C5J5N9_JUNHY